MAMFLIIQWFSNSLVNSLFKTHPLVNSLSLCFFFHQTTKITDGNNNIPFCIKFSTGIKMKNEGPVKKGRRLYPLVVLLVKGKGSSDQYLNSLTGIYQYNFCLHFSSQHYSLPYSWWEIIRIIDDVIYFFFLKNTIFDYFLKQ